MENQRINAKFNSVSVKKQSIYMWLIGGGILVFATVMYLWRQDYRYPLILGLIGVAVIALGFVYFFNVGKIAFYIEGNTLTVKGKHYDMSSLCFEASVVFGHTNKTTYNLDELKNMPDLEGLIGDIKIVAPAVMYKYNQIDDIVTLIGQISKLSEQFVLMLWSGSSHRRYTVFGGNPMLYAHDVNHEEERALENAKKQEGVCGEQAKESMEENVEAEKPQEDSADAHLENK